ncbi:tRNA (guanosine(37)-N1)-methyltransferase TrmD [soil metagenome]
MMEIDIVTIFPEMCRGPLAESIIGRAQEAGLVEIRCHDLRDWTTDKHRRVDDIPYGGGQGMVMKPEPFFAAVRDLRTDGGRVVLMTPQGKRLDQPMVEGFAGRDGQIIVLCGHYEGVDYRVIENLVDEEISIGDYVLTNGAIAATVFVDAVVRLLPGALGDSRSCQEESFSASGDRILEGPCYTRPQEFEGMAVPEILLSGHHAKIEAWKRERARERTAVNRPDLMGSARVQD